MARKVREVMTSPPTAVSAGTDLASVARTMRDQDIGAVIVTDGDVLQGLVTDRDLVVRGLAADARPDAKVGGVTSDVTVTVGPEDDVDTAVTRMRDNAIRRLPVTEGQRCVGIVSIGDLAVEKDPDSALADISASDPNV